MPLDSTGYVPSPRVLTPDEARDLAVLKLARHRIRYRWMWFSANELLAPFRFFFGHSCAEIAIFRASWYRFGVSMSAIVQLRRQLPPHWHSVSAYNDHWGTTHTDILQLFDRAIAELE
jgi:hypothetical protein